MRRKDREMDREFALSVTDNCSYGVLSMIHTNGQAYGIPLSIVRLEDAIYFHCAKEGEKSDALRAHPDVCLTCVDGVHPLEDAFTTEYQSAIIFGTARELPDEATEEKISALRLLCLRYTPANMDNFDEAIRRSLSRTSVWKITINHITGKQKKKPSC